MIRIAPLLASVGLTVLLSAVPALGQALRGVEDDPLARVGRTAGDPQRAREQATPTGFRAGPQRIRQQTQRRRIGTRPGPTRAPVQAGAVVVQPGGTEPTRLDGRRPGQQGFRTLERPLNTAVPGPTGDQIVHQGLPPVVEPRRRRSADVDPYAPLGLRLGTFTVFPTLEVSGGYDTNPERRADAPGQKPKGSALIRTEAGINARSDWSVHELNADLRLGYTRYTSLPDADRPEGQLRLNGRYDISRDTAIDAELRGRVDSQSPGSANLTAQAVGRPLVYQTGASLGMTQRFNRLALSLQSTVDRGDFEDAKLSNGQILSQQDRNLTQLGLRLRAAYEITPGVIPFAEIQTDQRTYDDRVDAAGFERSSRGLQARAGSSFEITRTLTGEVLGGWGVRRFEDQRLRDLSGPVVEGALTWSMTPLTTIRLRAQTTFDETTIAGSSGAVNRRISAELTHALLRNLTLRAEGSVGRADFNGIERADDTLRALFGVDYGINRNIVLRGSFIHERTTSNVPGNNVTANVVLFGARLQY